MFTGIIEEIGIISKVLKNGGGLRIHIAAPLSSSELSVNDSVAINGVCQTVISKATGSFEVEAVEETMKKTTFGSLKAGNEINLELPLKLDERLGGHLVLGHVDGTGEIVKIDKRENSWIFSIMIPGEFLHYVVPVGSISIDGVSLTIANVDQNIAKVSIIPHTMEKTIFKNYNVRNLVNLEFDIIGKYIERLLAGRSLIKSSIAEDDLRKLGF